MTIVDCGGGTIDLSTYRVVGDLPITVEESTIPDCMLSILLAAMSQMAYLVFCGKVLFKVRRW